MKMPSRQTWVTLGLGLTTAIIVAAVHWPVLSSRVTGFFDDKMYLVDNELVQNPGWATSWRFLSEVARPSSMPGYYQPLTMISLMLDHAAGGRPDHRLPFLRTSLALHVLNSLLLFTLICQLFRSPWIAAATALLFGLHPLTVEPIPWIGERGTLLAACFSLAAFIFYVRYTRSRRGWGWYIACSIAYLFALMSKPTSIMLPAALLAMDFWPLRRLGWRSVTEKLPLLALAAASTIITMISKAQAGSPVTLPHDQPGLRMPLVVCHNVFFYLHKIVWPAGLSYHYPAPEPLSLSHPAVLAGVVGTALLVAILAISLRWTRAWAAGGSIFFILIFPVIGVVGFSIVLTADKYVYLPAVGLLLISAWLLSIAGRSDAGGSASGTRRALVATVLIAILVAEAAATRHQLTYWKDTTTLARRMVETAPNAEAMNYMMGYALSNEGQLEEGIVWYRKAAELGQPSAHNAYYDWANNLFHLKRREEAVPIYEKALELKPDSADCRANLASTLELLGRTPEALKQYERAIELNPAKAMYYNHYARCLMRAERPEAAAVQLREHIRRSPQQGPGLAPAYTKLGDALIKAGRRAEAVESLQKALELQPDFAPARERLAVLQSQSHQ